MRDSAFGGVFNRYNPIVAVPLLDLLKDFKDAAAGLIVDLRTEIIIGRGVGKRALGPRKATSLIFSSASEQDMISR